MIRPTIIKAKIPELYLKLPQLNYMDDIVLSNQIPKESITKILNNIGIEKINVTHLPDGKTILSKKVPVNLNVYKIM